MGMCFFIFLIQLTYIICKEEDSNQKCLFCVGVSTPPLLACHLPVLVQTEVCRVGWTGSPSSSRVVEILSVGRSVHHARAPIHGVSAPGFVPELAPNCCAVVSETATRLFRVVKSKQMDICLVLAFCTVIAHCFESRWVRFFARYLIALVAVLAQPCSSLRVEPTLATSSVVATLAGIAVMAISAAFAVWNVVLLHRTRHFFFCTWLCYKRTIIQYYFSIFLSCRQYMLFYVWFFVKEPPVC